MRQTMSDVSVNQCSRILCILVQSTNNINWATQLSMMFAASIAGYFLCPPHSHDFIDYCFSPPFSTIITFLLWMSVPTYSRSYYIYQACASVCWFSWLQLEFFTSWALLHNLFTTYISWTYFDYICQTKQILSNHKSFVEMSFQNLPYRIADDDEDMLCEVISIEYFSQNHHKPNLFKWMFTYLTRTIEQHLKINFLFFAHEL